MSRPPRSRAPRQGIERPGDPGAPAAMAGGAVAERLQRAITLHRAGQLADAAAAYERVLVLAPGQPDALHLLGLIAHQSGQPAAALEHVDAAIAADRRPARYHNTRGLILGALGRLAEAADAFREALARDPAHLDALVNLGNLLRRRGDPAGAAELFRRALRQKADSVEALVGLGGALCDSGAFADAVPPLRRAQQLRPRDAGLLTLLGAALATLRRPAAADCFERALALEPDFAPALAGLADWNRRGNRPERAVVYLERAAAADPADPRRQAALADALIAAGRYADARACLEAVTRDHPDVAAGHLLLARLLRMLGRFDDSLTSLERAAALESDRPEVLTALAEHHGATLPAAWFDRLRAVVDRPNPPQRLVPARFALAQVLDARDEPDAAFAEFRRANEIWRETLRRSGRVYDPAGQERDVERLIAVFTPAFFAGERGAGAALPGFIVGLPRSGTTLLEQILASHSAVHAAGELRLVADLTAALPRELGDGAPLYPECLRLLPADRLRGLADGHVARLAELAREAGRPDAARVFDKQPLNFLHLGLIAAMWPGATILHCRRDPRDVLFSCFTQNFETPYPWAWDLESLAHFHGQYRRLMDHWRAVLPIPVVDVDYEALVADLPGGARRIVEHAGLAWEEACAAFHRTERPVATASLFQVRRPVYHSSVGRWRRYERHLAPLLAALGDSADG